MRGRDWFWYNVHQRRSSETLPMQIYLYTEPGCVACVEAKDFLKSRGISFEERNIRASPEHLRILTEDLDSCVLPTLVADDTIINGFDQEQFQRLAEAVALNGKR